MQRFVRTKDGASHEDRNPLMAILSMLLISMLFLYLFFGEIFVFSRYLLSAESLPILENADTDVGEIIASLMVSIVLLIGVVIGTMSPQSWFYNVKKAGVYYYLLSAAYLILVAAIVSVSKDGVDGSPVNLSATPEENYWPFVLALSQMLSVSFAIAFLTMQFKQSVFALIARNVVENPSYKYLRKQLDCMLTTLVRLQQLKSQIKQLLDFIHHESLEFSQLAVAAYQNLYQNHRRAQAEAIEARIQNHINQ